MKCWSPTGVPAAPFPGMHGPTKPALHPRPQKANQIFTFFYRTCAEVQANLRQRNVDLSLTHTIYKGLNSQREVRVLPPIRLSRVLQVGVHGQGLQAGRDATFEATIARYTTRQSIYWTGAATGIRYRGAVFQHRKLHNTEREQFGSYIFQEARIFDAIAVDEDRPPLYSPKPTSPTFHRHLLLYSNKDRSRSSTSVTLDKSSLKYFRSDPVPVPALSSRCVQGVEAFRVLIIPVIPIGLPRRLLSFCLILE